MDMKNKTFFFDFDGVLADSVEFKTKAFAELFISYGPDIQKQVIEHHRKNGGMTRQDKFRHYYNKFLKKPLDDEEMESLCSKFSSLVVNGVIDAPEIPGVSDFLKLWYRKLSCFVVSATPDDEIELIIEKRGLAKFFREVLGSSCTKKENLEKLIAKYNIIPKESLFFGDAESDFEAAKACGIPFIGIVPGHDAPLLKTQPYIKWYNNFLEIKSGDIHGF